tara:strand:- start:3692 stop:4252 length:561 start_codon:yes stop_codon:yes gene_type:complete
MVKRRLATEIGMSGAWVFYRKNVRVISKRLALDPRWKLWLAVTPDTFDGNERFWPINIPIIQQGSGDIGERMYQCLKKFSTEPTILVGTDIPDVNKEFVWQAFEKLKSNEAIFGPVIDGGFWSVGFKPQLLINNPFRGVIWSSGETLDQVIKLLPNNTNIAMASCLEDIDDASSFMKHRVKVLASI